MGRTQETRKKKKSHVLFSFSVSPEPDARTSYHNGGGAGYHKTAPKKGGDNE